ncbi:MAG: biotin transporter BioY, partial [Clostridia bacterium]|nr:biotin transporter BioY [Clostridia bacterium]
MKSKKLRNLVYTAISAGLLCVLAPIALPLGVIPITFTTLLLYIYALVFSPKISIPSILIYICLGIIGLPVFSSFSSGIGHLFSATGGF